MDVNFPHLIFEETMDPKEFGQYHGETFKEGIHELAKIRKGLMLERSPHLRDAIDGLAREQWEITKKHFALEIQELEGISEAANISIEDLVILNNYTDFRDIHLPEEGCTTVGFNIDEPVSGQTWDMHSTAKNYICSIERPGEWALFSLVGCLGMMGANKYSIFSGVNNMNTKDAAPGVLWPAFIRHSLKSKNINELRELVKSTPFTGAHNYLISDGETFEHWETSPTKKFIASKINPNEKSVVGHTNHCLTEELKDIEETLSQNSTSHERYQILQEKAPSLKRTNDLIALLKDHTGYPKSLCGHFQSGAQDPSTTCGGGVFDHSSKKLFLWRGCQAEDANYKERVIELC